MTSYPKSEAEHPRTSLKIESVNARRFILKLNPGGFAFAAPSNGNTHAANACV
jgi:hypothetical protein